MITSSLLYNYNYDFLFVYIVDVKNDGEAQRFDLFSFEVKAKMVRTSLSVAFMAELRANLSTMKLAKHRFLRC